MQSEFENARNSARDAEATQESEVVRLREALEKASAESDARMQEREATGAEVQALQTAVADASADREHEKRRTVQSSLEVEEDRLQWQNAGRMRDAQIAALKVRWLSCAEVPPAELPVCALWVCHRDDRL